MIIVLDTSCISAFILAERVELLIKILDKHEIVITKQIEGELKASEKESLSTFSHPKIAIKTADSTIADKYDIHIGEASVIMFAKKNNALAVIDDKKARKVAIDEKIALLGTAGLLKLGLEKGLIKRSDMPVLISDIIKKGNFYLSEELQSWLLE